MKQYARNTEVTELFLSICTICDNIYLFNSLFCYVIDAIWICYMTDLLNRVSYAEYNNPNKLDYLKKKNSLSNIK